MAEKESHQPSNIAWVVLAGALGVFAISGQKSSTDDANSTAKTETKEERKQGNLPHVDGKHALDPLDDFLAVDRERRHPFTDNIRDEKKRDYLIVTVPDPIDSQLGYMFDEIMDSIQRALEMRRYVIDRAWLPWELDKNNPVRTKIVADWRELSAMVFPFRGVKDGKEITSHREETPGTLLFRPTNPDREPLLIVFLVGENPTSGIDKRALMRAIELIRYYPPKDDPLTIRIVGPDCSGSQTSMKMVLHDPRNECFRFQVISGGATGVDRGTFCTPDNRISFQATVIPNKVVTQATLRYLYARNESCFNERDLPLPKDWLSSVAILTESNTGFGRNASEGVKDIGQNASEEGKDIGAKIESENAERGEEENRSKEPGILELRFPLRMASLRSRYEDARRRQDEKLSLPDSDLLVSRISNKIPNQDSIPLQDPATTTSVNGQVLHNILSIIRRKRIHYLGILASDVRDQIMLASAIREYCPAVQIFFIGCDRLLTLPEYSYSLKGVIIGSTYPLIPENQDRTDPKDQKKRLIFPSQEAQGYYNAILAQTRGGFEPMIEYCPPQLRGVKAADQIWNRPPVWITMIGPNGDLVPLQFFTSPQDKKKQEYVWSPEALPERPELMPLIFPDSAVLPLVLVGALCLLVVYYALFSPSPRMFWTTGQGIQEWSFGQDFLYRTICLISLIFLLVPILGLWWLANTGIVSRAWLLIIMILSALALFPPMVLKKWLTLLKASEVRLHRVAWLLYGLGVLIIFGTILSVWYHGSVGDGLDSWKALFFERALNLATGVSPLLPLALLSATFFFWAFFQLKKSHLADRFSMPCPYPTGPGESDSFKGIRDMDWKLRHEVRASWEFVAENPLAVFVAVLLVCVVVTICVYLLSSRLVPTPEGYGWDRIFFLGFVTGYFLITLNLMRFLLLWKRLKKLLHEIALVRMMHAFERLPHKISVVFGGYFSTRRPRLSQMRIPHHQLGLLLIETERLVEKPADPQVKDYLKELRSIQKSLADFSDKDFCSQPECDTEEQIMGKLSQRFGKMTDSLLKLLPDCWPKHSFEEAFGSDAIEEKTDKGKEKSHKDEPDSGSVGSGVGVFQHWVQQAEVFIAMQVVIYLSQFFIQLRNLAWSIIVCGSLLLLGATSYPFQPERLILLLLLALIGSSIAGILLVLVRTSQDELVSRIMRTTPNRFQLDWGFLSSFFTYIAPMGTVVALQLSGAFRFLLEPLVRLVH